MGGVRVATKAGIAAKARRTPASERLPETTGAVDIALAAVNSGKPIPEVARRVLEEQAQLIRAQRDELRLNHIGGLVRAVLWGALAIVAVGMLILVGSLLIRAARADALVVESFKVPPAMAQQGLTGDVIATQVLDKISGFQAKTISARAANSYDNNWGNDLKIDIPNTGATAEQLWKLLRGWLGKETRISGEIVGTKKGLALTARVGSSPGETFVSNDADVNSLVTKAAELIFKQTQPYRYAIYVMRAGRDAEGRAVLQQLAGDPSPIERKWALTGLAWDQTRQGRPRDAASTSRRALAVDPNFGRALANLGGYEASLGHLQAAVDVNTRLMNSRPTKDYEAEAAHLDMCGAKANVGLDTNNPVLLEDAASCFALTTAVAPLRDLLRPGSDLIRHDPIPASRLSLADAPGWPVIDRNLAETTFHLRAQVEGGSSTGIEKALQSYRASTAAAIADPTDGWSYAPYGPTEFHPAQAQALLKLGRIDEAAAIVAATPLDCYFCLRVRGMVAQAQGNLPQAQRWFAEAVKQGPRLAPAYVDWGKLLVHMGRPDTAVQKLARAAQLSPNWADPLKYWGDAFRLQGKRKEALKKYDAANKLAPKWRELQQARKLTGATS